MFSFKNKLSFFVGLFFLLAFIFLPSSSLEAKDINLGTGDDRIIIPGTILNSGLSGTGNRCLYVDSSNNIVAKGFDCGSSTGGDDMGSHSATQNIRLNSFWLSGDGGNEGVYVTSVGNVGVGVTNPGARLQVSTPAGSEGLRIVSASDWSPLNIRNSANTADIFRVDQNGSLAVGSIPFARITGFSYAETDPNVSAWAKASTKPSYTLTEVTGNLTWSRLTSFPSACSAGQYVTAIGSALTCGTPASDSYTHPTGFSNQPASVLTGANVISQVTVNSEGHVSGVSTRALTAANVGALSTTDTTVVKTSGNQTIGGTKTFSSPVPVAAPTASAHAATKNYVDTVGIDWSRLFSFPSACSAGQYVTAVGSTLTCATPATGSGTVTSVGTGSGLTGGPITTSGTISVPTGGITSTHIANGTIVDADVSASAAIAASKIQHGSFFITSAGTSGQVWTSDGSGAGVWGAASSYTHPTGFSNQPASALTGANVISQITVNSEGHVSGVSTRALTAANVGALSTTDTTVVKTSGNQSISGTKTFSSPVPVGAPTASSHAATKSYVDGAVSGAGGMPSGSTNQTLRHNGFGWAGNNKLMVTNNAVNVNFNYDSGCGSELVVNGQILTPAVFFGTPLFSAQCAPGSTVSYNSATGNLNFESANNYVFTTGPVRAAYKSSDGSTGITSTLYMKGCDDAQCTITIKNGIITANSCPTSSLGCSLGGGGEDPK
jgi:hypothetical protein